MIFTFCLGFRNWYVEHLARCLVSMRRMTHEAIILADLGSEPGTFERVDECAKEHDATIVRHESPVWSRSLALNIAARHVEPAPDHYLVLTDADMIFAPTWRRIAEVSVAPNRMCLTRSRDTSEHQDLAGIMNLDDHGLMVHTTCHPDVGQGAAMVVPSEWYRAVGGMDEVYTTWGSEENDLVWRAHWSCLDIQWLDGTFVVHQWHRRDWATKEQWEQVRANRIYLAERIKEGGPIRRNVVSDVVTNG